MARVMSKKKFRGRTEFVPERKGGRRGAKIRVGRPRKKTRDRMIKRPKKMGKRKYTTA